MLNLGYKLDILLPSKTKTQTELSCCSKSQRNVKRQSLDNKLKEIFIYPESLSPVYVSKEISTANQWNEESIYWEFGNGLNKLAGKKHEAYPKIKAKNFISKNE